MILKDKLINGLPTDNQPATSSPVFFAILLFSLSILPSQGSSTDNIETQTIIRSIGYKAVSSHNAELDNVRALPFGFHVTCEQQVLKIRSSSSATFIVRASKLCHLYAARLPTEKRDSFALCSNDPSHPDVMKNSDIPKCVDLNLHLLEI